MALDVRRAEKALELGARNGLDRATEHLRREAVELCPKEEGFLALSGQPLVLDSTHAVVSFGSGNSTEDYAVVQHERLDFYHDDGQAKFLEQPLGTEARVMKALMAEAVREQLR